MGKATKLALKKWKLLIKIFGFQIQYKRIPSSGAKEKILAAIKIASDFIPCAISNLISV